ncbi:hypothetical protein E2C01_025820 [Portunus trituberculatus]|uniref:Uncharacterized protein n=1 Tax=Portunus trituberculatus TaxID=210409 RepID=A0A5B7EGH4_PORTR|nr:hypothetical protein [Portunus trituberculatus]
MRQSRWLSRREGGRERARMGLQGVTRHQQEAGSGRGSEGRKYVEWAGKAKRRRRRTGVGRSKESKRRVGVKGEGCETGENWDQVMYRRIMGVVQGEGRMGVGDKGVECSRLEGSRRGVSVRKFVESEHCFTISFGFFPVLLKLPTK